MADGETDKGDQTDREVSIMIHIVALMLQPHASHSQAHFSLEFVSLSQDL